jgi:hypothetical protein
MCSRGVNLGKPPRQVFVIQLEEARIVGKIMMTQRNVPGRAGTKKRRKGTQEMTSQGGCTNVNRAHHSHNPHNHSGPTTAAYLVE